MEVAEKQTAYVFEGFRLNLAAASLEQGGQEVDLAPRAFEVLAFLVDNRARVVPKQELIEAVWKDTFVTDDALVQAITAIRRTLGDSAEQPRFIRTKARIGYQFIAAVEGGDDPPAGTASEPLPVWVAPVSRRRARVFLVLIQAAYLIIYSVTLIRLERASNVLGSLLGRIGLEGLALPVLVVLSLVGVTVRLYVMSGVVLDHPQTGRQFRRLFPLLFILDEIWAASPLLMLEDYGLPVVLVLVPILAYAPFSQMTMVRSAYDPANKAD